MEEDAGKVAEEGMKRRRWRRKEERGFMQEAEVGPLWHKSQGGPRRDQGYEE